MNGGSPDDLYRSAFALTKAPPGSNNNNNNASGGGGGGGGLVGSNNGSTAEHHSRHPSTSSSHSSFSLATSTTLSTPNDSPPLDFLNSPTAGGGGSSGGSVGGGGNGGGGGGGGGGKVLSSRHEIRRMRQDASASPYPPQPPVRSNSFSGSDSHRSSSSEAEDIGSLFPSYHHHHHQQQQHQQQHHTSSHHHQHHQHQDYSTSMYSQPNRSNPGLSGTNPLDPNPSFQRMTVNSDQALEQLAANVRAATTTSASDRAKHIFVQAWYSFCFFSLLFYNRILTPCCFFGGPFFRDFTLHSSHTHVENHPGSTPTTRLTKMGTSHDKGCTIPIAAFVMSIASPMSTPPPSARLYASASPPLKPDVLVSVGIANTTVRKYLYFLSPPLHSVLVVGWRCSLFMITDQFLHVLR